ncbi:MAG: TonB-dependent receptor [Bacteroidota bacterium]|nr:TonB-dependent receptor [Bacteroidota bacterium]
MSNTRLFVLFFLILQFSLWGQAQEDTIRSRELNNVIIKSYRVSEITSQLSEVHGAYLIGGRKTELLPVAEMSANLADKTGRQIFAKIPGAFIYDMDGSGNQVNIATRGLDPHRSWEFSIRQNGILINSDIYGYPASHYSMPMEAIRNIEVIRGTASLQYGAEFGGMINYVLKTPDTSRAFSFESINTAGSFGLLSSFNSIGGKLGRVTYYAYAQKRTSNGYRDNARSDAEAQLAGIQFDFSDKLNLRAEIGRSTYLYQIPGPLTDEMFENNPRQSTRSRNYFNPDIFIPSLTFQWKPGQNTTVQWILSGVFGQRNSVEFEGFADRRDTINAVTLQYNPRVINIDNFNSKTTEMRLIQKYHVGTIRNVLSAGVTYFNNDMRRRQQGKGSSGTDFDLSIIGEWGRDLNYLSESVSMFIENMFYVTPSWSVSPGMRFEYGKTDMTGRISYLDPADIPNKIEHQIPALGINSRYKLNELTSFYGGISQAYRPVLFKDIIPGSTLERANKDLKDAFGYNAELGMNGRVKIWLKYDITLFRLQYTDRLGNLVLTENNVNYIYKTNIGDSQTNGIECLVEVIPVQTNTTYVSFFTSTSLMKGTYRNAQLAVGSENRDISGNEVESIPRWISRNGLNLSYKSLKIALLYSYVAKSYSDPTNVEIPTPNSARGIVPAYSILDLNTSLRIGSHFIVKAGINNLLDKQYFTKRPLFYPGPGVWSSDGTSLVVSVGIKI